MSEEAFDQYIARVRNLRTFAEDAAKEVAPLLSDAVKETASSGADPSGKAWELTEDGRRPLANAADAIETTVNGPTIEQSISGHLVFHHYGGRVPQRQILPVGGAALPPKIVSAVKKGSAAAFQKTMGGK